MTLLQQQGGPKRQKIGRGLHNIEGGHLNSWPDPRGQGPRLQSLSLPTLNHCQGLRNSAPRHLNPALEFPKLTPYPTDPSTVQLFKPPGQLKLSQEYMKVGKRLQSRKESHLTAGKKSHKRLLRWVKDHLRPTIILGAKLSRFTSRMTMNRFYSIRNSFCHLKKGHYLDPLRLVAVDMKLPPNRKNVSISWMSVGAQMTIDFHLWMMNTTITLFGVTLRSHQNQEAPRQCITNPEANKMNRRDSV